MPRVHTCPRLSRAIVLPAAACVLVFSVGCYERVIRADGFGAQRYNVVSPNSPDSGPRGTDWLKTTTPVQPKVRQMDVQRGFPE